MSCFRFGAIAYLVASGKQPGAEVHVFKPDRPEFFIHAVQSSESLPIYEQKGGWRLLHILGQSRIKTRATIAAIDWIGRKDPIDPQNFKNKCRCSWKATRTNAHSSIVPVKPSFR